MKKTLSVIAVIIALVAAFSMTGCSAANFDENQDTSHRKTWGETTNVNYSFRFLVMNFGPYDISITPMGLTTVKDGRNTIDCIEVKYLVNSTDDGEPAQFDNCCVCFNMLDSYMDEVDSDVWYTSKDGTHVDIHGSLNVGEEYIFYVPISDGLEWSDIKWIALCDLYGFYQHLDPVYFYEITQDDWPSE